MTKPNFTSQLMKARKEIEPIKRDGKNPHFGNKYATLDNVITAVTEPLENNGFLLLHRGINNEHGMCITTELLHVDGERISTDIPLVLGKNDMQGLGSAITYARRYGILSLLNLPTEDDDGNDAVARTSVPQSGRSTEVSQATKNVVTKWPS